MLSGFFRNSIFAGNSLSGIIEIFYLMLSVEGRNKEDPIARLDLDYTSVTGLIFQVRTPSERRLPLQKL
jgi:hypothetical protein